MKVTLRIIAVLVAVSVAFTVRLILGFAPAGGMRSLATGGLLGALTLVGWLVALTTGPVAAIQLWRYRESGRRAGVIFFGYGLAYYVIGLFALRDASAPIGPIIGTTSSYAILFVILAGPGARRGCAMRERDRPTELD
jgi:hypothetical protein